MPERREPEAPPFWPRLARAVAMLMVAVSLHLWVGSAQRQPAVVTPRTEGPIFSTVLPLPKSPAAARPASPPSRAIRSGVEIETRFVRVPAPVAVPTVTQESTRKAALMPVGTTGRTTIATALAWPRRDLSTMADGVALSAPVVPEKTVAATEPAPVAAVASRDWSARVDAAVHPAPARGGGLTAEEQEQTVIAVLHEYRRAYTDLDVRATKAVYPTVDDRGLQRLFRELRGQQLRFASCGVKISSSGAGANAWCRGDATYRPKVGARFMLTDREWTFSLARHGSEWQILEARMQ